MKAKPVIKITLAVALCGGLLLAFPTLWMFLVLVILGLVWAQASLIVRNLHIIARDAAGKGFAVSAPPVVHAPPAGAPQPVHDVSAVLNRELFSRFRQHLESAEVKPGLGAAPAAAPAAVPLAAAPGAAPAPAAVPALSPAAKAPVASAAPHLALDGVSDRVAISGAAKAGAAKAGAAKDAAAKLGASKVQPRPVYPPNPRPKAPTPVEADAEEDLFADLRPNLAGGHSAKKPTLPAAPPVSAAEPAAPVPGQDEEASTLLKLAEDGLQRGDPPAAKAALGHYLSLMRAHNAAVPWTARRVQARLAVLEEDAPAALEAFEGMVRAGFEVKEEAIPALLDQLAAGAKPELADSLRVSLLLRVLAVFRQNKDRAAMDRLYRTIEEAQEKVGDERKLVQFLKNHLEIKKVMGETAGQVDLIDQIGNRLFKLGETAAAREYYEMGLKLRAELQQAQPATEAKTGTTTQTA